MGLVSAVLDPGGLFGYQTEDTVETERLKNAFSAMAQGVSLDSSQYDLETTFYILGLSPNAARLSVRFFEVDTLDRLTRNFGLFLQETSMIGMRPCSLKSMLLQVAPLGKEDEIPSTLMNACFASMLNGSRFPQALYYSILSRMRCDHAARNAWDMGRRAALLKACLVRKRRLGLTALEEGSLDVALNTENHNKGYLLGRLFAVMEHAQRGALGEVNSTIRDKYIGAASTTPGRVFPHLFHSMENHVSNLRKTKPGLGVMVEKAMDEIVDSMDGAGDLPKTLNTDEQGQFYIGYYQQRVALWQGRPKADDAEKIVEDATQETN